MFARALFGDTTRASLRRIRHSPSTSIANCTVRFVSFSTVEDSTSDKQSSHTLPLMAMVKALVKRCPLSKYRRF